MDRKSASVSVIVLTRITVAVTFLCAPLPAHASRPPLDLRVQIEQVQWQAFLGGASGFGRGNVYEGLLGRGFEFAFTCSAPFLTTSGGGFYPAYWKKPQTRLVIEMGDFNNPNKHHYCELKVVTEPFLYQPNNTPLKTVPIQTGTRANLQSSRSARSANQQTGKSRPQSPPSLNSPPYSSCNGSPVLPKDVLDQWSNDFTRGPVYRIGGDVSAPVLINKIEPSYSLKACEVHFSGTVLLSVIVDEHGLPRNIKVIRPLGLGLDEKAIEAVHQWRFRPGMKGGHPVSTKAQVEVNFRFL